MPMLGDLPDWIPDEVSAYLIHIREGVPIRRLAKAFGCDPSTISRRIRRVETRRDDILVDAALSRLEDRNGGQSRSRSAPEDFCSMSQNSPKSLVEDPNVDQESMRVLRRLNESGACLALAPAMDTAVVVRDVGDGPAIRTAIVDRYVAEAMAVKEWIEAQGKGRILRYRITSAGRAVLREHLAREESERALSTGTSEDIADTDVADFAMHAARRARYTMAESPLNTLARRKDRNGDPFLSETLVAAGERLREDFELAQMGTKVAQDWQEFLTGAPEHTTGTPSENAGVMDARARLADALAALGPGLGDVAVRCSCFLEGLESVERRMGWSARSGKIVLRIALQRLKSHYDQNSEHWSPLIG